LNNAETSQHGGEPLSPGIASVFERFELDENSPYPENVQRAAFLARFLQDRANELQTPQEHRQQAELDRMIKAPKDKATLIEMTDQAFRAKLPRRAVDQLTHILDVQGIPRFFSMVDRALLRGFQSFGGYLPGVSVPFVKGYMQKETANVILPAELDKLATHLKARNEEGVRMNVNFLGEAILGEKEALRRVEDYLAALQQPEIEVVSVKISTIFSQISPLARTHTVATISKRMELLYRAAAHSRFTRADGQVVPKFVYMDMEEYRDMDLTVRAFIQTLDRPGLNDVAAGIVLQSYTPDSFAQQCKLNEWARDRVASGGAPITLRLVKGANMEMERVEASGRGWPQAPYKNKRETDANFKRMLLESVKPENLAAVRVGVASHNLFDLAFAVQLAVDNNALDKIQFEMLEGMANHQRRALFELTQNLLLYSPACHKTDFIHAIGYLIRRLDENTGPDNFLSHAFNVRVDSDDWRRLEQQFLDSFSAVETVSDKPRRTQDRNQPPQPPAVDEQDAMAWQHFVNEPDTDFSLPHTALRMLREKPSMNLLAETGGKNATIVTAMSDRDQAIKHVLHSAFGHSGQKCSATSLLILEEEVYNDENFRRALCDAVASMDVGSAWDLQTKMGPLIRPADGVLGRGLKQLETGESWAVMPDCDEHNPCLVTPGVKWGVRPNSFTHMTELFGPVLGVMKAKNLHEAISLVNATGFGLTSGLESLDDREQETWLQSIRAGNLYVNRSTTGAIVLRQPFGGMGKSAVGPGIKAGGPNYVAQLMDFTPSDPSNESATIDDPQLAEFHRQLAELAELASQPGESSAEQLQQTVASIQSYVNAMTEEFGRQHDHFRLIGQDNLRSYPPVAHLRIRLHPADNMFEMCARIAAARAAGCQTTVSIPPGFEPSTVALLEELTRSWAASIEFVEETEEELAQVITTGQTDRLRYAAPNRISEIVERAAAETGLFIASSPVLPVGRVELLWYLEEQSICIDYHRYGNLGGRSNEQRAETL